MQLKDSSLVWTQFLPVRSYIGLQVKSPLWDLMRALPSHPIRPKGGEGGSPIPEEVLPQQEK